MKAAADLAYWPADTSQPVLELTTGDLLREAAAGAGTGTALVEAAPPGTPSLAGADRTDRRWTYRQLLAEAEQCAHWLLTRFSPGERITIWAPNIPEWIAFCFEDWPATVGAHRAGGSLPVVRRRGARARRARPASGGDRTA
jgi:non-ribosomal peptide synthetase component F